MFFQQIYLGCLAQASYLIACKESGVAAVVDPRRDVDEYLELAKKHGFEIRHVILTHFHADFVSGHLELRERCKAKIHLGRRAKAEYPFEAAEEGHVIALGPTVRLAFLETPGHTPESVSVLVHDLSTDAKAPLSVLTGDTLFIGDVGRPDLMSSKGLSAAKLAGMLHDSLHEKLLALPDDTLLYPGHGAGSACGKNMSTDTVSTIGAQRKLNYALQPMSRKAFVKLVTSELSAPPSYFSYDAELNRKKRPTLAKSLARSVKPLALARVLALKKKGAQILDARSPDAFERGYLAGTINIPLDGKYATWAGTLLSRKKPIVVIADPGTETETVVRLGRIGLDNVIGYLEGGPKAFAKEPELRRSRERMEAKPLASALVSAKAPVVVDVRTPSEWAADRIEGSINIPLDRLEERLREVPRGERLVIQCRSGYRSSIAASILAQHGIESANLAGGILAWSEAHLPTVSGPAKKVAKVKKKARTPRRPRKTGRAGSGRATRRPRS